MVATAETIPVAVMRFAGDDPAITARIRDVTVEEVRNQKRFSPLPLNAAGPRPDEPPDPSLLSGLPYVFTGEYYFDADGMHHFQLWLWNSETGALVYTDELLAEDVEEAEGYLPALVTWVFSKIPVTETVTPAAAVPEPEEEAAEPEKYPKLFLGLRAGGSQDFQFIKSTRDYSEGMGQSFGGEGAITVEFRPWRNFGFQAEGVFAAESFDVYSRNTAGSVLTDRYGGAYLLFPLLLKAPLDLDGLRLSFLGGPAYILPLPGTGSQDMPLALVTGIDLGGGLGPGELYGSLRAGIDLGLTSAEDTALSYTRWRVGLSAGYKFLVLGRN